MVTWKLLTDEAAIEIWDEALLRLDDYTPFQSYAWGEYRRALGWEPCRWAAFNEGGEIVAMMAGQLRRYPLGFGLIWSEGGPVGDLSVCDDSLQQAVRQTTGVKRLYVRFRCDRARRIEDVLRLNSQGWSRTWFNLTTNFSMSLDLNREEDRVLAACDRNWRRNLRRANESSVSVRQWLNPGAEEVLAVYASMQNVKGLEEQQSLEEIEQLLKHFKQQLVLYRCDDQSGELVSLLGWVVLGKRAWAVLWATSEAGRKLQASHAIFWALVQHCLKLNVESCDLAGIDPIQNHGVYRFKRDTGALPLEYLGEWDWASRPWMRWLGNWAIARRSGIKQAEAALKKSRPAKVPSTTHVSAVDPAAPPVRAEFVGTPLHAAAGKL
jgi:lipid II:glycine glycyltransferase (peptidoglycan interpeptide bridge formation enzyme)